MAIYDKIYFRVINFLKIAHKKCYEANLTYNNQSDHYYKNVISKHFNKIFFFNSIKELPNFNNQDHIFIVGLPRSGSSLVETIITHNEPNITSVGEFHGINKSNIRNYFADGKVEGDITLLPYFDFNLDLDCN